MSYQIQASESVQQAIQRIATEQIDRAIDEITDSELDGHKTVHQVRKRCKKLRGLVRLVRPQFDDYQRENKTFRDAARTLSYVRDAQSMIETFDELIEWFADQIDPAALASVREGLVERRRKITEDEMALDARLEDFLAVMQRAKQRVEVWTVDAKQFDAVRGGLAKTYGRGRQAMKRAYEEPSTERFHEWRKRVKYHWYHIRLLESIWEPLMGEIEEAASALSDYLGDDHDLAVLHKTVVEESKTFGDPRDIQALASLIASRRAELQHQAERVGSRLFAEKPKHFVRRLGRYWKIWRCVDSRAHGNEPSTAAAATTTGV